MKLEYIWIEKYNQMRNFEISLSSTNKFKVYDLGYQIKLIHELNRSNLKDFFHVTNEDGSRNECVKDIVALVGKNGAGKSTSLDLILEIFMNDNFCRVSDDYVIVISDENNKLTIITTLEDIEITKIEGFQYNIKDRTSLIEREQKEEYDEELEYYNHYNEDLNKFHVIYYSNSFEARRGLNIFKSYSDKVYDISTMSQLECDNIRESEDIEDKTLSQCINTHFIMDIIRQVNFILDVDREERHTKIKIPDFITLIYDDIDHKVKKILSYLDFSMIKYKEETIDEVKLLLDNYHKELDKELTLIKNTEKFKRSYFCSALTIKKFVEFFERRKTHSIALLKSIKAHEYYKIESMKQLFIEDLFFNSIISCIYDLMDYDNEWLDNNIHVILDESKLNLFSSEYINKSLLQYTKQDEESIGILNEELENSKTILDKITWYSVGNENIESILQLQVNLTKTLIFGYLKLLENIDIEEIKKKYSYNIIEKTSTEVNDNVNDIYDHLDILLSNIKIDKIGHKKRYKISLDKEYREQLNEFFLDLALIYESTDMIRFEWNLSTGENNLLNFYGRLNFTKLYLEKEDIIILIDEAETSYHPSWQQDYINSIIELANTVLKDYKVQFVITTHSPLILSDLPDGNVKYLKSQNIDSIETEKYGDIKKTFGANIYELYNDSLFLESSEVAGVIGTFANRKIKTLLEKMDTYIYEPDKKSVDVKTLKSILFEAEYIIEIVGDKLTKSIIKDKYSDLRRLYILNKDKRDDEIESFYKNLSKSDKQKLIDIILRGSND